MGKPDYFDPEHLKKDLAYLEKWVSVADRVKVVEKLYEMIPQYTPSPRWWEQMTAAAKEERGGEEKGEKAVDHDGKKGGW